MEEIPVKIELRIPRTRTPVLRSIQKQHFGTITRPPSPFPIFKTTKLRMKSFMCIYMIVFRYTLIL